MADLTWVKTLKIDARGPKSPKIAQNRPKSPKIAQNADKTMRARAESGQQLG
jgi:hypothetical protein